MVTPQGTDDGLVAGHIAVHSQTPKRQSEPDGQRVPKPQTGAPGQALATCAPQSTVDASGQRGVHTHAPPVHVEPAAQSVPVPGQGTPGHALGGAWPHATVLAAGQRGSHSQARVVALQR